MNQGSVLRRSVRYLVLGLDMVGQQPWLFARIAFVFSLPACLAAAVVATAPADAFWRGPLIFVLQSITTVMAPVVFMMAVSAVNAGERVPFWRMVRRALPWVPRYVWTNVHTSLIFWVPVGMLIFLREWVELSPAPGFWAKPLVLGIWWVLIAVAAVFFHSRTVLAPFLAVHGDLPATLAAWESWRLSWKHLPLIVTTLLLSAAPASLPLILAALVLLGGGASPLGHAEVLPQLTGVALQLIRLTVVPAFYMLYRDLWYETGAVEMAGESLPGILGTLLTVTSRRPRSASVLSE